MQILAKFIFVGAMLFSTCFVKQNTAVETLEVVGVSDGDTITILDRASNKRIKVRLATIDAPEQNQPFGTRSKHSLSELVYNKNVSLKSFGNDQYGRQIAEVFVGGNNINVEQIKRGMAWHYKHHEKQQSAADRLIYSKAQNVAKESRLGLWGDSNPIPPWDFRRQKVEKSPKPIKYLFVR